ncbi:MAG: DUF302 domain-containing protein [Nitrospirae bacterium]|nr:DUF302 domain-containing protein [Nitrospirota bacterium]
MRSHKTLIGLAILLLATASPANAADGLVNVQSPLGFRKTAERLESVLKDRGMTLFSRIDHADNATRVGKQLRPTELFIYGNPRGGTLLMLCNQRFGIDLPLKVLVWQDKEDKVWLTYNGPRYLAERHAVTRECGEIIKKMEDDLHSLIDEVTVIGSKKIK